ncbi:glycosyltransferase family 2 protein [Vibrio vulnificus]
MINIFILNWNSTNDIDGLLKSLTLSNNKVFRVILIHNGTDDWNELVDLSIKYSSEFEIHVVNNGDNLGYAGGNNAGFEYLSKNNIDGDLLILNPDVILDKTTIDELVLAKNSEKDVGSVMVRTFDDKNIIYDSIVLSGFTQKYSICPTRTIISTDYCAGSCMLIDREMVERVGLFDENYFLYWEEVDFSLRIKENGYKLLSTTKSKICRKENSTERSSNAYYYFIRNSFLLRKKFPLNRGKLCHYWFIMKAICSSFHKSVTEHNFSYLTSSVKGLFDGIKKNYGKRS